MCVRWLLIDTCTKLYGMPSGYIASNILVQKLVVLIAGEEGGYNACGHIDIGFGEAHSIPNLKAVFIVVMHVLSD